METLKKTKKEIFKEYALSSFISFTTGFALYIVSDPIFNPSNLSDGVVLGAVFAAVRAGMKAAIEYFVVKAQAKMV